MDTPLPIDEESGLSTLSHQIFSFLGHSLLALAAWAALMTAGYIIRPAGVPQTAILALSIAFPLLVGFIANRFRQSRLAPSVWLIGFIWIMIVALKVLDMPTGPNECFQCGATEKLTRTFLSIPRPSGLMDDDGPFIATWPAAALIGYAIGARLALRRSK